jgi:hypothetical protein
VQAALGAVTVQRKEGAFHVKGELKQAAPYYKVELPLRLKTADGEILQTLSMTSGSTPFEIKCHTAPRLLSVDPDFEIFRRLNPSEIPPSVNSVKGAPFVLIVLSSDLPAHLKESAGTLALSLGLKDFKIIGEKNIADTDEPKNTLILVGTPKRRELLTLIPPSITLAKDEFILSGKRYSDPHDALFAVVHHPSAEGGVIAIFQPSSSDYADIVARKITHYGKYSYLAFTQGQNRDKGVWPVEDSPLVHRWTAE